MTPPPRVEIENLRVRYGSREVLKGVSFKVQPNEVLDERGKIFPTFTQGGDLDTDDVQAIEQILAEQAVVDSLAEKNNQNL